MIDKAKKWIAGIFLSMIGGILAGVVSIWAIKILAMILLSMMKIDMTELMSPVWRILTVLSPYIYALAFSTSTPAIFQYFNPGNSLIIFRAISFFVTVIINIIFFRWLVAWINHSEIDMAIAIFLAFFEFITMLYVQRKIIISTHNK